MLHRKKKVRGFLVPSREPQGTGKPLNFFYSVWPIITFECTFSIENENTERKKKNAEEKIEQKTAVEDT
jgi:hypothetical protein